MRRNGNQPFSSSVSERGIALFTSIFALLLLTLLGWSMATTSLVNVVITKNAREATEAFYIAEAGVAHATAIIGAEGAGFDSYLQAGNGTACDGDELSDTPSAPLSAGDEITSAQSGGHTYGSGRYEVSVCDDHDFESTASGPGLPDTDPDHDANNLVRIVSAGYGPDSSTVTLEARFTTSSADPAVLIESDLEIEGSLQITGSGGAVHSNGDLDLDGQTACAEKYFSAVGSILDAASADTGTSCNDSPTDTRSGAASITIPNLNPLDFKNDADWILKSNGTITDQLGTPQTGSPWDNWSYDSGKREWTYGSSDDLISGTYYSEGSIEIDGDPGEGGPPLKLTFIAEGHIVIDGDVWMEFSLTKDGTAYALISGHDIEIDDEADPHLTGQSYARHQIEIDELANAEISGQIIALSDADTDYPNPGDDNPVELDFGVMEIGGPTTIHWDGGGGLTQVGWRECRGADPDNPCQ